MSSIYLSYIEKEEGKEILLLLYIKYRNTYTDMQCGIKISRGRLLAEYRDQFCARLLLFLLTVLTLSYTEAADFETHKSPGNGWSVGRKYQPFIDMFISSFVLVFYMLPW